MRIVYLLATVLLASASTGCMTPGNELLRPSLFGRSAYTSSSSPSNLPSNSTPNQQSPGRQSPEQYAAATNPYSRGASGYQYPANQYPVNEYPVNGAAAGQPSGPSYVAPSTYNAQPGAGTQVGTGVQTGTQTGALPSQTASPYQMGPPPAGRYSTEQLAVWSTAPKYDATDRFGSRGRASTRC